jgi:uncharacterized membrane protein
MTNPSTSTGLQENVASLLCYVLGWVSGIVFLIIEPKNKTIKFHALQSIFIFGALSVINMIFTWIPFLGWVIGGISGVVAFILWIVLMVTAVQGRKLKIWVAGDLAEKYSAQ